MEDTETVAWPGLLELGASSRGPAPTGPGVGEDLEAKGASSILPGPEIPGKLNLIMT